MSSLSCKACGAAVLDIDVQCSACGRALSSTGAQRMIGSFVLHHYQIVGVLGQGGMSVVYRARHQLTQQEVALKVLPPELAAHSQVKTRFLEEARALAKLDHPNIVHLYNFGEENGCFVLAMQFVRGKTLERLIVESGTIDWAQAAWVAIDVLKALAYAHSRGIIHRDMKPSNILVREEDSAATVMDFGIAKMTTKMASSARLTATGQTMGTVRYMSPEQVRGLDVDPRTDLYSLGVTLYEAIAGDTPFDGDTHFEIMTKHLHEPPIPLSGAGRDLPKAMDRVILKALSKNADDRYQSAGEFRRALTDVLDQDLASSRTQRIARARLVSERPPSPELPAITTSTAPTPTGAATAAYPASADTTDLVPKSNKSRRLLMAIGISSAVVLSATAALVVDSSENRSRSATATAVASDQPAVASARSDAWPEPYLLDGLEFAVDQRYEQDKLRIMSVATREVSGLRDAFMRGHEQFMTLLAERGVAGDTTSPPMTVQIVPQRVLCDPRIYQEIGKAAQVPDKCERSESWYRPRQKTWFVADRPQRLRINLAFGAALGFCLHANPPISGCEDALEAFDKALNAVGSRQKSNRHRN